MSETMYEVALLQISRIGCEVLMMSPVVGDPLLDRRFPYRLKSAKNSPGIARVHFFTNFIGAAKFTDQELWLILNNADTIMVSVAPNRNLYLELFGVDRFQRVVDSLVRAASIFHNIERKPSIIFQGRAKEGFDIDHNLIDAINLFGEYATEHWITEYKDWGGTIRTTSIPVQKYHRAHHRVVPCERALVPVVFCDGKVGLCACADYDQAMVIGDLMYEELEAILVSEKRRKFLRHFLDGCVPEFCAKCTFYEPHPRPLEDWINLIS